MSNETDNENARVFVGCIIFIVAICVAICAIAGTVWFLQWVF